jgi:phospholipase/carboxylesterase
MTKNREYFVSEPEGAADACVIWMHGLGADGKDFFGIVDELGLPINHAVRFIFPSAPFLNITINNGMLMRGWYDIFDLSMVQKEDAVGMKQSQQIINEIIQNEIDQGISTKRIILAGFSQGGAMALYAGLRYPAALGGLICLSAYLPLITELSTARSEASQNVPIFMAHGIFDPVVPYNMGHTAYEYLSKNDYQAAWHSYPMAHTLCLEEISAIGGFINRCLGYD